MKQLTLMCFILIVSVGTLTGQEAWKLRKVELGGRYMPTFSALDFNSSSNEVIQGNLNVSHGWGGVLGINFTKNIGIQGELDYYELTQKYRDRSLEHRVNIKYYNIPVMISLNTDKTGSLNLNVVTGPQLGITAGSVVETNGNPPEGSELLQAVISIRDSDVGLAYGAGLEFMLNESHSIRLDLGFRGFYGLIDMTTDDVSKNGNTYNVIVKTSRQTYAGYGGLSLLF